MTFVALIASDPEGAYGVAQVEAPVDAGDIAEGTGNNGDGALRAVADGQNLALGLFLIGKGHTQIQRGIDGAGLHAELA